MPAAPIDWVPVLNTTNSTIPGGGLILSNGLDANGNVQGIQPTGAGQLCLVSDLASIPPGQIGQATYDNRVKLAYDTTATAPNPGETWGSQPNKWLAINGSAGFAIVGGAGTGIVNAVRTGLGDPVFAQITAINCSPVGTYLGGWTMQARGILLTYQGEAEPNGVVYNPVVSVDFVNPYANEWFGCPLDIGSYVFLFPAQLGGVDDATQLPAWWALPVHDSPWTTAFYPGTLNYNFSATGSPFSRQPLQFTNYPTGNTITVPSNGVYQVTASIAACGQMSDGCPATMGAYLVQNGGSGYANVPVLCVQIPNSDTAPVCNTVVFISVINACAGDTLALLFEEFTPSFVAPVWTSFTVGFGSLAGLTLSKVANYCGTFEAPCSCSGTTTTPAPTTTTTTAGPTTTTTTTASPFTHCCCNNSSTGVTACHAFPTSTFTSCDAACASLGYTNEGGPYYTFLGCFLNCEAGMPTTTTHSPTTTTLAPTTSTSTIAPTTTTTTGSPTTTTAHIGP